MEKNLRHGGSRYILFRFLAFSSLMAIILFSSGCGPYSGGGYKEYYVGTEGIVIEFFKSNPKTVFEEDPFTISMFIKNEGTFSLNGSLNGVVALNYDEYYLTLTGDDVFPILLDGKNLNNPEGDEEYFEFLFDAKSLNNLRESVKTKINFDMCYPYRTEMSTAICLDTRISQDESVNACKTQVITDSQGQGAPIAVTRIEPEMMIQNRETVRPIYKIYVVNRGKGYVINRPNNQSSSCDNININRTSTNLNKVTVNAYLSNIALECIPSQLKLTGGDDFVRCQVTDAHLPEYTRAQRNYVAPLTVVIDYSYVDTVETSVEIKRRFEVETPVRLCGYYEVQDEHGNCISRCENCAKNPNAEGCQHPPNAPQNFQFREGYSCSCSKAKCSELAPYGDCVFGFCPGSDYCCITDECQRAENGTQCGDNHVCLGGACSGRDECWWGHQESNWTCHNILNCQEGTVLRDLCPGAVDNVCCLPIGLN